MAQTGIFVFTAEDSDRKIVEGLGLRTGLERAVGVPALGDRRLKDVEVARIGTLERACNAHSGKPEIVDIIIPISGIFWLRLAVRTPGERRLKAEFRDRYYVAAVGLQFALRNTGG